RKHRDKRPHGGGAGTRCSGGDAAIGMPTGGTVRAGGAAWSDARLFAARRRSGVCSVERHQSTRGEVRSNRPPPLRWQAIDTLFSPVPADGDVVGGLATPVWMPAKAVYQFLRRLWGRSSAGDAFFPWAARGSSLESCLRRTVARIIGTRLWSLREEYLWRML